MMFTPLTLAAISILYDISFEQTFRSDSFPQEDVCVLLDHLEAGGLICLSPEARRGHVSSYRMLRPVSGISLLQILEAIGEHLDNNYLVDDDFYSHYGAVARKLGVINHVTRACLAEIRISDLRI